MERTGFYFLPGFADEAYDSFTELRRRPVGEGHREDPPGGHALHPDQIRDTMGENARLAGAGAGQDEHRPFDRRDGARLFRVQPLDDLAFPRRGRLDSPSFRVGIHGRRRVGRSGRVISLVEPRRFGGRGCVSNLAEVASGSLLGELRSIARAPLPAAVGTRFRIGGTHASIVGPAPLAGNQRACRAGWAVNPSIWRPGRPTAPGRPEVL